MTATVTPIVPAPMTLAHALEQWHDVRNALADRYRERAHVIDLLGIAVFTGSNACLVSLPGTGKSALVDDFFSCMSLSTFTTLCHRQQTLDELFGPIDLPALQTGRYVRATTGTLLDAEAGFLDEAFKASGVTLNPLLRALNERQAAEPGRHGWRRIPLRCAVLASNELPGAEDGLAAFYDRVLVRAQVEAIKSSAEWMGAAASSRERRNARRLGQQEQPLPRMTREAVDTIAAAVAAQPISAKVMEAVHKIQAELRTKGLEISDRRAFAALDAVAARSVLQGATEATTSHIEVLEDCFWDLPEQRKLVHEAVSPHVATWNREVTRVMAVLDSLSVEVANAKKLSPTDGINAVAKAVGKAKEVVQAARELAAAETDAGDAVKRIEGRAQQVLTDATNALRVFGVGV